MKALLCVAVVLAAMPSVACSSSAPKSERVQVKAAPMTVEIGSAPQTVAGGRLVLHLADVQVAEGETAILRVFVNRPDATADPADRAGFVEELVLVPSRTGAGEPGARAPGQHLTLPLPAGVVKPGEPITVTIVPVAADAQGLLAAPGAVDVTLERPYVTVEADE